MFSPAMTTDLLETKDFVENFLKKEAPMLSAYSFINIFSWSDFFNFNLQLINDHLCVFAEHGPGTFLYLPPLAGNFDIKTIDRCFDYMESTNQRKGVSRIENVTFEQLAEFPKDKFKVYQKNYEYCYFKNDLMGLRGNVYKSQRALVNQFTRSYDFQFLPYQPAMYEECIELYKTWAHARSANNPDPVYRQMLQDNEKVHRLILGQYHLLGVTGHVVKIENRIAAYTFGFEISPVMFCVHSEIADIRFKGLAAFIFHSLCKNKALERYAFINCMDDFELPNIQKTKMSYNPSLLLPSYIVSKI